MNNIIINMPKGAAAIIDTLQSNGFEAYLVGGCVRDSILNRPVHDWDITTSATPDEMKEVFFDSNILETGIAHGTLTIQSIDGFYECTTYRIDGEYSDGRQPDEKTFTDSLVKDLSRRDFTINAMAYNDKNGLIDPFGGMKDIGNGIIRCVGDPMERFKEDALRIMRALRFSAQLMFTIDIDTMEAAFKLKRILKNVSMERINGEFCKIMICEEPGWILEQCKLIFKEFIPEISSMIGFLQNNPYHVYDVWDHTFMVVTNCDMPNPKDLILRLAAFFHDIGKPHCYQSDPDGTRHFRGHGKVSAEMTDKIMQRLKFDNKTREKVVELVYYHNVTLEITDKCIKRWLNKIGEEQFKRLLSLRRADILGQSPINQDVRLEKVNTLEEILEDVLEQQACFSIKNLAVNGDDLIAAGMKPGKEIGAVLNQMLDLVLNDECANDKNTLFKAVGIE